MCGDDGLFIVGDGGQAALAKEKPGTGSQDEYSKETSITEPQEGSMGLSRANESSPVNVENPVKLRRSYFAINNRCGISRVNLSY
ncbi:hypothetical protein Zmor_003674 [Zophobas morio]|uniref:Uncharacterized protein n=1 Tax=Zophobas morio TaxID=2755281 RepID=A0AA38M2U7_9CUCU|nr:hypothetical protein Zmor_003674 [Zophobas morio]